MRELNGKTIVCDFDGVLAANNHGNYADSPPHLHGIEQINKAYDMGYKIVLFTARYGDRMQGCIQRQYQAGYVEWLEWMKKYGVKYDEAWLGKPAGDLYVDDKACRVESSKGMEDWENSFWPALEKLKLVDKYNQNTSRELDQQAELVKEFT